MKHHWKKIVSDPNFLGEADFQENEEKVLTIGSINESETVATAEGKTQKAVIHWKERGVKPMILNVARAKAIEKVAGSPYMEDWIGVSVQCYIDHGVKAFGDVVSAVRVRKYKPRIVAPVPPCADCKQPIGPASGHDAQWMAAYTSKNYGAPLCAECAAKRKAAMKAQEETKKEVQDNVATESSDC